MTQLNSILDQIEAINRTLASVEDQDPREAEEQLQHLELLRENLNQLRRDAEGGIDLARKERQEAINEEQRERLS